jgi:Flp pilus assembly protein TadD
VKQEENTRNYEEAIRAAIEEGRRLAQAKKIRSYMEQAKLYLSEARFEEALSEITRVFRLEPDNAGARELEQTVYTARAEHQRRREES